MYCVCVCVYVLCVCVCVCIVCVTEPPSMPTLPEEEQDSPKEPSRWSSPSMSSLLESRGTDMTLCPTAPGPPRQAAVGDQVNPTAREQHRTLDWKPNEKCKGSSGQLCPRYPTLPRSMSDPLLGGGRGRNVRGTETGLGRGGPRKGADMEAMPARGVAKPVPHPSAQQEVRAPRGPSPMMQAVTWDAIGSLLRDGSNLKLSKPPLKSPRHQNPPTPKQQGRWQKLAKMRELLFARPRPCLSVRVTVTVHQAETVPEQPWLPLNSACHSLSQEHQLLRHHAVRRGSRLPDLSETAEQDRGTPPEAEGKRDQPDVLPHISDITLRKLKLHRAASWCAGLCPISHATPGPWLSCLCGCDKLTLIILPNAFVQLSLAFRNDSYTLETRQHLAERERNLTEENTERELNVFKGFLKGSIALWQGPGQEESHRHLLQTAAVLQLLAVQLSSQAEMVGAMRQGEAHSVKSSPLTDPRESAVIEGAGHRVPEQQASHAVTFHSSPFERHSSASTHTAQGWGGRANDC
ncbi:hypothetical protein JZ751_014041 [Albula glossodonta]|uniref:Uncharacterized protein n=1 Tax=Albula glossodonta TaxID=121402 RepID=A0A8T2MRS8_9TELE|nr:hypothetical protein JZ751_014041 [Albula glossodonta]